MTTESSTPHEAISVRLGRHMTLAVLTPVALLIVLGGVLAWQIARMSAASDWIDHTNVVIGKFYDLRDRIAEQEASLRGYLITGERAQLAEFNASSATVPIGELRTLTADNPQQVDRLAELSAEVTAWRAIGEHAIAAPDWRVARDDTSQLVARQQALDQIHHQIEDGIAHERSLLFDREVASADTDRTAKIVFIALIALAALSIAFVSRRQLSAVSRAFAALVDNEREARQVAARWEWVRRGQATITGAVLSERSTEQVATAALDALVSHTGAAVGAMYRISGERLIRVAGHALAAGEPPALGGQIGQAIADRKPRRVTGLVGAELKITSGVGERDPAEVSIAPAIVDDKTIAVIELGFAGAADERLDDLLSTVTTSIAIAIRAAEQRARLQELFEETQRQGEELAAQHEELRVNNEELEAQSIALREANRRQQEIQAELEAANANLEEQTAELEAQKDEMAAAQTQLEQRARELAQASQYKSEFLAKMSHELRTPLNSSLILARLLADNPAGNLTDDQVRFAHTIHAAGNDLLVLINDILDLAKIEAGRLELRVGQVQTARIRDTLLREFEPVATNKQLKFSVVIAGDAPAAVFTDEQRLVQVLRNLISNACKFTDRGEVEVGIAPVHDASGAEKIALSVRDTGIGIPREHLERVFDAFHQVDGSGSRRHGGTGLGLAISRELAALLGGTLDVHSEAGKGSTFTLVIPRELGARTPVIQQIAMTDAATNGNGSNGHGHSVTTGMHAVVGALASTHAGAARPQRRIHATPPPPSDMVAEAGGDDRAHLDSARRTLLIIEDDPKFAAILRDLGREQGFQCVIAGTADDGVALALRYVPDGILLDMKLPDHSGLTVLERLKRQPQTRHIPVHVCSVDDHIQRSLELGAIGYLMKPATRDELVAALRRIEDRTSQRVRRLLIVEDDPVQAEALGKLLGGDGVEVDADGTIKGALAKLKAATYDCVVMDLRLEDGTGFELLDQMAHTDAIAFPPVIVHTGKELTEDEEAKLRGYSSSIIVKGAKSADRLVDEVTLFLHQVESELPPERQRLLRQARDREAVFEGRRVLIVEDDVRNVFALSSVLEPRGLTVRIARNGREALDSLAKQPVDMVLMDVMMPEMDGIEATRQIRAKPSWARLPIIALTAKAMADDRAACIDAGANDYLAKPINVDMLLSLMRVWMPR